jgi:hypothetical protein
MRRAAEAPPRQGPHPALPQARPFVLDKERRRGKVVGDVVDEYENLDFVSLHK